MSSTTGPYPPQGTAAHLPPGGLIAIVWSSVVLAGVFGMYMFGATISNSGSLFELQSKVWEQKALAIHLSCLDAWAFALKKHC